jgi:hypothetical protein
MKPLYACSKCGFVSPWRGAFTPMNEELCRECGKEEKSPLTVDPAGEE